MTESVDLGGALPQINLEQALVDAEIANARVVDLTERLNQAQDEILRLRAAAAPRVGPPTDLQRAALIGKRIANKVGRRVLGVVHRVAR